MAYVRSAARLLTAWLCCQLGAAAQSPYFAGALGGVSTLSADAQTQVAGASAAASAYKPENGAAVNVFAGIHLREYLSIQGCYAWNRNDLSLTSAVSGEGGAVFYEQARDSSQHAFFGELLVYFRDRASWVRPYLSAGGGMVRLASREKRLVAGRGGLPPPQPTFASAEPALRVAVGMDLTIRPGWAFRYSFSETIRQNPISARLSPPGSRNLANYQNLFGLVRTF